MGSPLPLTIDFGTLPANGQGYTVQQLADKLGTNGRIFTEQAFALFTTGATAPTSNTGPWAANGNTWYYYDSVSGTYKPFLVPQESLKYWVGSTEPDPDVYQFWIQLNGSGSPLALKTYFSGGWVDVYAATLAGYQTVSAMANYYTKSQTDAAITAAIAGIPSASAYPGKGVTDMGGQSVLINSTPQKVNLMVAAINPDPSPWDITNRRYIAPADGIYSVNCSTQFDNVSGTPSGMQVEVELYKNGSFVGEAMADLDSTPSPSGDRWSPGFGGLVSLAQNDYLELFATAEDGVNTGLLSLTVAQMSVNRVG